MAIYTAADLHTPRRNGKGAAPAEPAPPPVEVLSLEACARLLHLNERTLSSGIEEGIFPGVKVGTRYVITAGMLRAFERRIGELAAERERRLLTPETVETEAALRQHAATATPEEREALRRLIFHPETHHDPRANEPA
jgi:hypothetical protein